MPSTYTTDALTVSPPLTGHEQRYLHGLCRNAAGSIRRPGYHCPWQPSDDGATLHAFEEFGTKQPVAEWAAYLASHLLGPNSPRLHGRVLKGFTYDHVLTGRLAMQGRANGDRWTLIAGDDGVVVERTQMPCASCWAEALLAVRPTQAYRFVHPVREANLIDGRFPDFDHAAMETECLSRTWAPVGLTRREVVWPPAPRWLDEDWWVDTDLTPGAVPFRWGDESDGEDGSLQEQDPFPHLQGRGERRLADVLGVGRTAGNIIPFTPRPGRRRSP